jgi:hypothetical protein
VLDDGRNRKVRDDLASLSRENRSYLEKIDYLEDLENLSKVILSGGLFIVFSASVPFHNSI